MRQAWWVLGLVACGAPVDGSDDADTDGGNAHVSAMYDGDENWLCLPGKDRDWCASDLTATELMPDGSEQTVTPERAEDPAFDCFYVYPTVRLTGGGQDPAFEPPYEELDPLLSQAAPLTRHCAVYAPYYHQAALDGFGEPGVMDAAYAEVLDAFREFLADRSHGRPFALLGHSQGTGHLTRLLAEEIDGDAALRDRLVVAILLGGSVHVPVGEDVGGSFQHVPICTAPGQLGCVAHWVTYADDSGPGESTLFGFADEGQQVACTDPLALAGRAGERLAGSWFPTEHRGAAFTNLDDPYATYATPFVKVGEQFRAACVVQDGASYLEVSADPVDGDQRRLAPYRNVLQEQIGFGMHVVDWNMPMDDILAFVGLQAEALEAE